MSLNQFECTSESDVDFFQFEIKWNVHRNVYEAIKGTNDHRKSITCKTNFYNSSWFLKLQATPDRVDIFEFFLVLENSEKELKFGYKLIVNDEYIEDVGYDDIVPIHVNQNNAFGFKGCLKNEFYRAQWFWDYDDYATFICKIKATLEKDGIVYDKVLPFSPAISPSHLSTLEQYLKLFETGLHSDITLVVNETEFKAHKGILAAQCSYFEAMFGDSFRESKESKVVIDNVKPSDFEQILKFIYGEKLPNEWNENTVGLLIAADRFGLERLIVECEKNLTSIISPANCLILYQLADSGSRTDLKAKTLDFTKNNYKSLIETEGWKELEDKNIRLLASLMKDLFEKML